MNNHNHQKAVVESEWRGPDINEILSEDEFLAVCKGEGYNNWDDNYYCMIEQQLGEHYGQ